MKKTILTLAIALSFTVGQTQAQENAKHRLAEKLLVVMEMQKTVEQSFATIPQMIGQAGQSPEAQKVLAMIQQELSWKNIKGDYIQLYADVFTETELKGLIEFYESPAGQAFVKKQPELNQRTMLLSQQLMLKIMPKLQDMSR